MFAVSRKLVAEAFGTGLLVLLGAGVATLSFGFRAAGASISAGVVATALTFGLILLCMVYAIGPISGCHINPAVTLGALLTRRITLQEALGYWIAQLVGGVAGALLLWAIFAGSPSYSRTATGLGANGFGRQSMVGIDAAGAFLTEVVITAIFVFVVLSLTRAGSPTVVAGVIIGLSLTMVHIIGIPLTGTSVNPARSIGPAIIVGGAALSQLWLFIVAPLVGGAIAALAHDAFNPSTGVPNVVTIPEARPAETPTSAQPGSEATRAEHTG